VVFSFTIMVIINNEILVFRVLVLQFLIISLKVSIGVSVFILFICGFKEMFFGVLVI